MVSIDSAQWRVREYNGALCAITQRASGSTRYVHRSILPSSDALAAMTETRFNAVIREAFHDAAH